MVQAAVDGVVDFRRARFYDTRWHQHLRLILDGLSRRNRRTLWQLSFEHATSVYTSAKTAEAREELAQQVSDRYYDIYESYYPHEKDLRVQHEKQAVKQDVQGWEARYGSLKDEKTQKEVEQFVQAMERLREETAAKSKSMAASQLGHVGEKLGLNQGR